MNEEHLRLLQAAVGIQVESPSILQEPAVDVDVDLANLQTDEIEKLLAQLQGDGASQPQTQAQQQQQQEQQQQQQQQQQLPQLHNAPGEPSHHDDTKTEELNQAFLTAELEKTIQELSQVTSRTSASTPAATYPTPNPSSATGYQTIGHASAVPQPVQHGASGHIQNPTQAYQGGQVSYSQRQQHHQTSPQPFSHANHQSNQPQQPQPQHRSQGQTQPQPQERQPVQQSHQQQNNYARPTVPRRPATASQHGSPLDDVDDPSKAAERERIREENRERKKRWREVNQDRNKDNDLRCRVTKRAAKLFGSANSEEKQKWIAEEFNRRKNKREQKEKARSEGPHLNGASGVFVAGGHDYIHHLLPSLYAVSEQAATEHVMQTLRSLGSTKEALDQFARALMTVPRIVDNLLNKIADVTKREQLRQYIAANRQNRRFQHQSHKPSAPPSTPTGSGTRGPNDGFDGTGNLPEGFDAILADIQRQLPVVLSEHAQAQAEANQDTEMTDAPPLDSGYDLPDLSDDDDVDVDALLAALQAADNHEQPASSADKSSDESDAHTRGPSMEAESQSVDQHNVDLSKLSELSQEDLERLLQVSGVDLNSLDIDVVLQTLQDEDSGTKKAETVEAQDPSPVATEPVVSVPQQQQAVDPTANGDKEGGPSTESEVTPTGEAAIENELQEQAQHTTKPQEPQTKNHSAGHLKQATETLTTENDGAEINQTAQNCEGSSSSPDEEELQNFAALSELGDLDSMDPEQIDALLNELRGAGEAVEENNPHSDAGKASPGSTVAQTETSQAQTLQTQAVQQQSPALHTSSAQARPNGIHPPSPLPPPPAYTQQDVDTSNQYTPETIAAILRCLLEGLPQVPQTYRGIKRPPGPYPSQMQMQKRIRGPSPNILGTSPVNQLQGILHNSMDRNPQHHGPSPPMPPAFSTRLPNNQELNKKLMALKPPPYKPPPKPAAPPVVAPPVGIAPPKRKEDEKRIKAMGFPPLMAGLKRAT